MGKGHLSSKVPGVKLRPARPRSKRTSKNGKHASLTDEGEEEDTDEFEPEPTAEKLNVVDRPFKDVRICFSAVRNKRALMGFADDLGAAVEHALTDTCTHLVAADHTSPKYQVALGLGLPILTEEWLSETHRVWMEGGEVSLSESVEAHRLPPFQNLRICLSGYSRSSPHKSKMISLIHSLGGYHSKDLDLTCTHLIPMDLKSAHAKIDWTKKQNSKMVLERLQAQKAGKPPPTISVPGHGNHGLKVEKPKEEINIVWEQWFWDCVNAHGRWIEEEYFIEKPVDLIPPRPTNFTVHHISLHGADSTTLTSADLMTGTTTAPASAVAGGFPGPSRTSTVDDHLEQAVIRRQRRKPGEDLASVLFSATQQVSSASSKQQNAQTGVESDQLPNVRELTRCASSGATQAPVVSSKLSRIGGLSRAKSFTAETARTGTFPVWSSSLSNRLATVPEPSSPSEQIFRGLCFCLRLGSGKTRQTIEKEIRKMGGEIGAEEERADYLVVKFAHGPHKRLRPLRPHDTGKRARLVTDYWVESCLAERNIQPTDARLRFTPVNFDVPLPGCETLLFGKTNLMTSDWRDIEVLVLLIGGQFTQAFPVNMTHLICDPNDVQGGKYETALKLDIPVVSPEWLGAIKRQGRIPELDAYRLGESIADDKVDRVAIDAVADARSSSSANVSFSGSLPSYPSRFHSLTSATSLPLPAPPTITGESPSLPSSSDMLAKNPFTTETTSTADTASAAPLARLSPSRKPLAPLAKTTSSPGRSMTTNAVDSPFSGVSAISRGKQRSLNAPPALTPEFKAFIDQMRTSEADTAMHTPEPDQRSSKRKRILGRPGGPSRLTKSPSVVSMPSTSPQGLLSTVGPPLCPPPASYHRPNSPPLGEEDASSPPGGRGVQADESLRVFYDDPDARAARQRLMATMRGDGGNGESGGGESSGKMSPRKRGRRDETQETDTEDEDAGGGQTEAFGESLLERRMMSGRRSAVVKVGKYTR